MKLLFMILAFLPILSIAQKNKKDKSKSDASVQKESIMPLVDSQVVYTEVIKIDSVNKNELYNRAKRFFVTTYKSANDVIQLDDKENGQIIGKGIIVVNYNMGIVGSQKTNVYHTISITAKDGRYKYEIIDLIVDYYSSSTKIGSSYISGSQVRNPIESYLFAKNKMPVRFAKDVNTKVFETIELLKIAMSKSIEIKKDDW